MLRLKNSEWSKSDRGEISYDTPYMWNLKRNDKNDLLTRETHRLRKRIYSCQGEGRVRDFGMDMYTRLYLKWITNKDLL